MSAALRPGVRVRTANPLTACNSVRRAVKAALGHLYFYGEGHPAKAVGALGTVIHELAPEIWRAAEEHGERVAYRVVCQDDEEYLEPEADASIDEPPATVRQEPESTPGCEDLTPTRSTAGQVIARTKLSGVPQILRDLQKAGQIDGEGKTRGRRYWLRDSAC